MLHRPCFFLVATVLMWSPGSSASSNENSISWSAQKSLVNAVYTRGRRQIMEADISPACRQTALTVLAKAAEADSEMKCESTTDKVEDIADILLAVWDSIGNLGDDVNTMINGIPLCMSDYGTLNIPGKLSCFFAKFWPIWNAVKHFWNYTDFWMKPYKVIKDFATCMGKAHASSTNNVKMIVNNARFCH